MPTVDLYDAKTDPKEHPGVHKAHMYVQDVDDAVYCCYFPTILKAVAQSWFNYLPPGSVTCFQDLVNKFVSQFIPSWKKKRSSIDYLKSSRGHRSPSPNL